MHALKFASLLILSSLVACCLATLTPEEKNATRKYFDFNIVYDQAKRLYYCDINNVVQRALRIYPLLQSGDVVVDKIRMLEFFDKLLKIAEGFPNHDSAPTTVSLMQWIAMVDDEEGIVMKALLENMTDNLTEGKITYEAFKEHYFVYLDLPVAKNPTHVSANLGNLI